MCTLLRRLLRSLAHLISRAFRLRPTLGLMKLGGQVAKVGDAEEVVSEDGDEDVEEYEGEDYAEVPL
jgi:hypothetical protein